MARRKSNFELLRIVSIFFIVLFHCAYKSGFSFGAEMTANHFLWKMCWMLGELGVNLFILISGYFMLTSRFQWKKLVLLLAEVLFYHLITIAYAQKIGAFYELGSRLMFLYVSPLTTNAFWFIQVYLIIYVLSPFLNHFARSMKQDLYQKFLLTLLALYSVIPTMLGLFYNSSESVLYYNRLIWFVIVYFIGAYIRQYPLRLIRTRARAAALSAASLAVMAASIWVIHAFSGFFRALGTTETAYLWTPNNVPMVLLSIGVFVLFERTELPEIPIINRIASTSLGVYVLHDGALALWIWCSLARCQRWQHSPWMILHMIGASLAVVAVCAGIDLVRQFIEKHTLLKLLDSRLFTRRQPAETGE